MNNILSYCELFDARISATEKDLPVLVELVYDQNHIFGLGPIPKPKPKYGPNFRPIPKLTETEKNNQLEMTVWPCDYT